MTARPFPHRRGNGRTFGQALVEVALVLPIFLLMLMILFDFGRVIYAQNAINQDAREGVRKGIVSAGDLDTNAKFTTRFADIRAASRLMAPAVPLTDANISGGGVACSAVQNTPIFGTPPMPDDAIVAGACFYPNGVKNPDGARPPKVVVKIQITVTFITPIISNLVGPITLSSTSEQLLQS